MSQCVGVAQSGTYKGVNWWGWEWRDGALTAVPECPIPNPLVVANQASVTPVPRDPMLSSVLLRYMVRRHKHRENARTHKNKYNFWKKQKRER